MDKKPWTKKEILEHVDKIAEKAGGDSGAIMSAIGMLVVGRHFGWKVMYLTHSQRTIRKYEEILGGIDIKEVLPAEGEEASRSLAWLGLKKVTNFWKAVKGEIEFEKTKEFKKATGT